MDELFGYTADGEYDERIVMRWYAEQQHQEDDRNRTPKERQDYELKINYHRYMDRKIAEKKALEEYYEANPAWEPGYLRG